MRRLRDQPDDVTFLRDEFRRHLEEFYRRLKLAPPYQSVEKAIAHFTASLRAMAPDERKRVGTDPDRRWAQYRAAFVESGLHRKHRGIIAGMARSRQGLDLPAEYHRFLDAFIS